MTNISAIRLRMEFTECAEQLGAYGRLNSPHKIASAFKQLTRMQESPSEEFWALFLSSKLEITGVEMISKGSLNTSIVHPREVYKSAVLHNSAAICVAHNHPSGDPTPSQNDINITRRLQEAGHILGIEFLDHIIIGGGGTNIHQSLGELGYV